MGMNRLTRCFLRMSWQVALRSSPLLLSLAVAIPVRADTFVQSVALPSVPITVSEGSPLPLTVDFGMAFQTIDVVKVNLEFAGDLWDLGETWHINVIGGQSNLHGPSSTSASLHSPHATTTARFLDGYEAFTFSIGPGAVGLYAMEFVIEGVPEIEIPEPSSLALVGGAAMAIAVCLRRGFTARPNG